MRQSIIVAALLALLQPAGAADLPVKAPRTAVLAPLFYGGSGAYCGAGAGGEATRVASTYEAGGLLNLNCGYTFAVGPERWAAVQANYARSNVDAKSLCGAGSHCVVDSRQSLDIKAMYGAPLSVLSGIFSNAAAGFPTLPPAPPGAINTTMHPYLSAGVRLTQDSATVDSIVTEKKNRVRGILGVGAMYQTNSNTTVSTFADWTFGSGRFLLQPGAEVKVGSTFRFGVVVNYGVGG